MGMGWKERHGGLYSVNKCKCGKGEVRVFISPHEESDYPPFVREDSYEGITTCPDDCINIKSLSEHQLKFFKP